MIKFKIFESSEHNVDYWVIGDSHVGIPNSKEDILNACPEVDFKGELKMENDILILDDIEVKTRKYNL